MKKTFTKIFITTLVVAGFAMGVSYVSAQNNTNGPADRTKYTKDLPIWTGSQVQEKDGGFLSKKHIGAPVGLFKKGIYLPGSNAKLRIGSADGAISLNPALFGDTSTEPVVIDMQKRTAPTDGTKFINGGQCTIATRLTTTGSQAYEFKTGNNLGNVIARQVQLTGGKPAANKILVSDTAGNATWAKAKVENGQVVFTTDEPSPVPAGQCAVPPVDLCPNIAGTQTTVPAGMALDTNGNCVTPPVVDLCTNIAGNQTTVPVGMVKDTPGDTPGNCTIPPVDLCSNIAGNQTTVPVGMVKDTTGNTPGNCTTPPPVITYAWVSGSWSSCPTAASGSSWQDLTYPDGQPRQTCSDWLSANGPKQNRTVVCKSSTGQTVADSFCTDPKPATMQACPIDTNMFRVPKDHIYMYWGPTYGTAYYPTSDTVGSCVYKVSKPGFMQTQCYMEPITAGNSMLPSDAFPTSGTCEYVSGTTQEAVNTGGASGLFTSNHLRMQIYR